jgi:hypothetical protein
MSYACVVVCSTGSMEAMEVCSAEMVKCTWG